MAKGAYGHQRSLPRLPYERSPHACFPIWEWGGKGERRMLRKHEVLSQASGRLQLGANFRCKDLRREKVKEGSGKDLLLRSMHGQLQVVSLDRERLSGERFPRLGESERTGYATRVTAKKGATYQKGTKTRRGTTKKNWTKL